jgi:hypothetical protein
MSKESGGFLRKVVRFVANPTTDWAELDTPNPDALEADYDKTEIKAMIERKRRNDFVRKRELDMLRKIRREGLSPDNALALGSSSNLDADSRPQTGTRSDIAVKAKIDEIELQMVGGGRAVPMRPAAQPSVPGRLTDAATTAPNNLTAPATLPYDPDEVPQVSEETMAAMRSGTLSPAATPSRAGALAPADADMQVHEVVHDPELDEAVIAFANADFDQCERCLLELVHPGAARYDQMDTWLVLFDLYRTLDLPHKFDNLAVSFVQKFGVSAPQWYSLPKKVAEFLAARPPTQHGALDGGAVVEDHGPDTEPLADADVDAGHQAGWRVPPSLDGDAVAQLRVQVLQLPRPWLLDWSHVAHITAEGAAQLSQLMRVWALEAQDHMWMGTELLLQLLADLTPTSDRGVDPAYWMLRLDVLRLCNRPVEFDEVAIDYCVTFEQSPPSWEPAACRVRAQSDGLHPQTRPLSHVSEVTTSFVESQLHNEVEFVQVAALNLSGQLVGDIGSTLTLLDDQLGASVTLDIDCEHLLRVDFIAAGDLLNWVLARRAEDRQVVFRNPHRLIALFFGAMGINEHARVKLLTV